MNIAGRSCTEWLVKIVMELGMTFSSSAEKEIVKDIKEKLGYVAIDYEAELEKYKTSAANDKTFELADGNIITIQN